MNKTKSGISIPPNKNTNFFGVSDLVVKSIVAIGPSVRFAADIVTFALRHQIRIHVDFCV